MKKSIITFMLLFATSVFSQGEEWSIYNTSNSDLPFNLISALASDSQGNIWIGTGDPFGNGAGLAKYDGENWTIYNTSNSDLPYNAVFAILPDDDGLWVGTAGGLTTTGGGLAYLDGETWTIYNTTNSELPVNDIVELAKDAQGNLWIGTYRGGLAKFDSTQWTVYDRSNSDLPTNNVFGLAFDDQENLWVGTFGGLAKFDGENWTIYNTSNSDLPHNMIYDLAFDSQGVLWIATANHNSGSVAGGLAGFDGENWIVYNTSNSILPHNDVYDIEIDDQDNVWIGCGEHIPFSVGGLLKFNGADWTLYDKSNSPMPYNLVYALTIDPDGNVWTGSVNFDEPGGLVCLHSGAASSVDMNGRGEIYGSIHFEGTPLCALVLANGQYMFTCGDSLGLYDLTVTLDENGEITLYGFCSGFSPFKTVLTPEEALDYEIQMTRAAAGSKEIEVTVQTEAGITNPDFIWINGTVTYNGQDLCTMVLANGQNMFTCGADLGAFDLEVPLDGNGEITLYCFCSGFAPFKDVFMP